MVMFCWTLHNACTYFYFLTEGHLLFFNSILHYWEKDKTSGVSPGDNRLSEK